MYLTKTEKNWLDIIIQERLNRMDKNISEIEDKEDKVSVLRSLQHERDTLTDILYKL